MGETLYDIRSEFYTFNTDRCGNGGTNLAVYRPTAATGRESVAVIAVHRGSYTGFSPMVNMARRGFVAAGVGTARRDLAHWLAEVDTCVRFVKDLPGVEKVVFMAHSQGGCLASAYQYIAENGTDRFRNTDRAIPFPEIGPLTPVDGLMLLDANYGIMHVLALDPAVRTLSSSYDRIPELDIFEPANGYRPGGSTYTPEFIRRFQRAQVKMYKDLLAQARERLERIQAGHGMFRDDEPLVIPGARGGSSNNKPFCMDTRLLGRTSEPRPLLHPDGAVTCDDVVRTVRRAEDSVHSSLYRGASVITVRSLLEDEVRLEDGFGYDDCHMWGVDGVFNPLSTRENVKHIHVPLLCQGNTASHEFVNTEFNYMASASEDKEIILTEGSCHDFAPVDPRYGDTNGTSCDYFASWLSKPGRFLQ